MLHSLQTMNWGFDSPMARLSVVWTISFVGVFAGRFFWAASCFELDVVVPVESVSVCEAESVSSGVPFSIPGVSSPFSFVLLPAWSSPSYSSSKVGRVVNLRRFLCPVLEGGGEGGVDTSSSVAADGAGVVALMRGTGVLGFALK